MIEYTRIKTKNGDEWFVGFDFSEKILYSGNGECTSISLDDYMDRKRKTIETQEEDQKEHQREKKEARCQLRS
mgnify:CR=1 FL=1